MRRKIRELFLCTRKLAPRLGNSPSRLENQSTVGLGFPDTWHRSSTRSPKNAVTLVGPRKIWGFKLLSSSSGGNKTSSSASGTTMIDHNYGYHVIPVDHHHLRAYYYFVSKCKLTLTMDCTSEIKGAHKGAKMCIDPNLEGFNHFFLAAHFKKCSIDKGWPASESNDQSVWFPALIT